MSIRVFGALAASAAGWGLAAVGVRAAFNEGASTFTVVTVRIGIATLVAVGFLVLRRVPVSRLAWIHGALIGIPRIGLAPVLFIASLNYISAGFEGLLITLIPVATAVMAYLVLGEHLSMRHFVGLGLGLSGTALLIASGDSGIAQGGNTVLGGLLALGGVVMGSLSGVLSRKYAPRHTTAALSGPMFMSGAVVALTAGLLAQDIRPSTVTAPVWLILVGLALGSTLLPFVATLFAAKHTTATRVALVAYVAPLISVAAGIILLDEVLTGPIIVGGVLALAGVVIVGSAPTSPVPPLRSA